MAIGAQERQPQKGLTFEDVWAMFQESKAEHDRMIAETDKAIKELSALVDRVTQNVGGLNRSVGEQINELGEAVEWQIEATDYQPETTGELIEILIASRFWEKFAAYSYQLRRAYQRYPVYTEQNQHKTDIGILLFDAESEWCMAVEVKRYTDDRVVDRHLKRMDLIRRYPPPAVADKRLLGAIAGGVVPPDTVEYAHKAGFFVLELTGGSVTLLDTPAGFVAREW